MMPVPCPHRRRAFGRREPRALAALFVTGALCLTVACSSRHEGSGTDAEGGEADVEALRAIPYLEFSLETDPSKLGVTIWDEERAWAGVNLYVSGREAVLLAMNGRRLHTWDIPKGHDNCEYFELLDDGDMVLVCVSTGLLRLDWGSRIVWEVESSVHHDVHVTADRLLVPVRDPVRRYRGRKMIFDSIAVLSHDGQRIETWETWEHLDELKQLHEPSPLEERLPFWHYFSKGNYDYYHLNTIELLGDTELGRRDPRFQEGNWLVCLRNADLILILDRDSREVVWHWGPGTIEMPHMPTQLGNGNILVYDNQSQETFTRVVEVEPTSGDIVWDYRADPPESFRSPFQGSNQRLANGNTLICDSEIGRAFEVTADGDVVWEWFNPDLEDGKRRSIYRVTRMDESRVRQLADVARRRLSG